MTARRFPQSIGIIGLLSSLAAALLFSCASDAPDDGRDSAGVFDYPSYSAAYCRDECAYANDGKCNELDLLCSPGTDCTDCGGRITGGECVNTCRYAHDGVCDSPQLCAPGTDCADCTGLGAGGAQGVTDTCDDSCFFSGNDSCDEQNLCDPGTDCTDCTGKTPDEPPGDCTADDSCAECDDPADCGPAEWCDTTAKECRPACAHMTCGTDHDVACGTCTGETYCDTNINQCVPVGVSVCVGMTCGTDQGVSCGTCTGQTYCDTGANQCVPACAGMVCGEDHGVSCGTCPTDFSCDTSAHKCVPATGSACQGMTCGTDQGISCGTCAGKSYCDTTVNQCAPACTNMTCGTDHGVSCGTCSGQTYCDTSVKQCMPACTNMNCGMDHGISCGTCTSPATCNTTVNQCETPVCAGVTCGYDEATYCGSCSSGTWCDVSAQTCNTGCTAGACGTETGSSCGACSVLDVVAGRNDTCAILADRTLKCWGNATYGQLGAALPSAAQSTKPVGIVGLTDVARVAIGIYHICVATLSGEVKCLGMNTGGQLGYGSTNGGTDWSKGPRTALGLSDVTDLTAGGVHTCALTSAGTVWCWGQGDQGQLGQGTLANSATPLQVPNLTGVTQIAAPAGGSHTCALLSDGTVQCWGYNFSGQLGDGSKTNRPSPVVVSGLTGATSIAAGAQHTCAVLQGGTAKCWGNNGQGQIGSTTSPTTTPVVVTSLTNVQSLAAGGTSTCATKTDASIWCWGSSVNLGQLGDGGATSQTFSPVQATQITGTSELTMGDNTMCAMGSSTVIKCIGLNNNGQLGNGSTTNSPTAVSVIW